MKSTAENVPVLKTLPRVYRYILTLTRRHGLHTLARIHGGFFKRGHVVALPYGGMLYIPNDPHYFGYTSLMHERHIGDVILSNVRPGDVCIDVGANIGYFSAIMAARATPGGMVYAFEPVPETFAVLSANAELAASATMRILPFCQAVSAEDGELSLARNLHSTLHQVLKPDIDGVHDEAERVTAVNVHSALEKLGYLGDVALIKIDVEGHELAVIEGARPLLDQGRIRRMIVEVFPGISAQKIQEVLDRYPCRVRAWLDNEWRDTRVGDLVYMTDVLVEFHPLHEGALH